MNQRLVLISLVIDDYDRAIQYYTGVLGFRLVEDTVMSETKRWVVVRPEGESGTGLLLAKAVGEEQKQRIGNQTGGRVFLFLHTDDFYRDYDKLKNHGVEFIRGPVPEPYGTVAVFRDIYGNLWDLIQPQEQSPSVHPF